MNRQSNLLILVITATLLLVAACGGQSDAPAPEVSVAEPEPTALPAEEASTQTESDAQEETSDSNDQSAAGMRTFVIDPSASNASYLVDEEFLAGALDKLGISAGDYDVVGSTTDIEGRLEIDAAAAAVGGGEFQVNLTTLKTNQDRRDNWIQDNGPKFGSFPLATFVIADVQGAPSSYSEGEEVSFQLIGEMTVRDVTQTVTFDVTAALNGDTLTGTALAPLKMTDFEIEPPNFANTLKVADDFFVQVDFTAVAQ